MIINRLFVFLLRHLWRLVRWAALSVYHGIAVLYRRRQARLQASDWRPRTVYNRAIRDEAEQKFPFNVICKTSHQLAWPTVGKHYSKRLVNPHGTSLVSGRKKGVLGGGDGKLQNRGPA
ncbi:hypothetical protein C6169_11920 [Salmonella enterica]|uniref:hypothetical protein n=1 Tax=Salmonella enterica TaxID=28901 RepID=UPI0013BFCCED|nr:hypothetical protein [Salmonella enterica]EAP0850394.1 hypothetical protein [Salmonella enterica]EAS2239512.1 hypothetical protein [Salmonella enterica]EAS3155269.1 hypothetical protein [Salmonella enterica]EDO3602801.1 hypothetical protein [Salmonella enterica]